MSKVTTLLDRELRTLIINCLQGSSTTIRHAALKQAQTVTKDFELAGAILVVLGQESDRDCLIEAIKAYAVHGQLGEESSPLLLSLMTNLQHRGLIAVAAIRAFAALGGDEFRTVSATFMLLNGLTSPTHPGLGPYAAHEAKSEAIKILKELGPAANMAVPMLANFALNESEAEEYRSPAIRALTCIGATADQVSEQLVQLLVSSNLRILSAALFSLQEIGVSKAALQGLIGALNWQDPELGIVRNRHPGGLFMGSTDMHQEVIELIASLGADAMPAVPALEKFLERSVDNPRVYAQPTSLPPLRKMRGRPRQQQGPPALPTQPMFTSEAAKTAASEALLRIRG